MIDDLKTIEKVIQQGIKLQEDMAELKNMNTDHETNNPQMLWETFKKEVKKIAKSQNKNAYHKITSKICNLEQDRMLLPRQAAKLPISWVLYRPDAMLS
jgi:hypothetical protein